MAVEPSVATQTTARDVAKMRENLTIREHCAKHGLAVPASEIDRKPNGDRIIRMEIPAKAEIRRFMQHHYRGLGYTFDQEDKKNEQLVFTITEDQYIKNAENPIIQHAAMMKRSEKDGDKRDLSGVRNAVESALMSDLSAQLLNE